MNPLDGPRDVIWDITYACPLRCVHCYSESGRRASRQLSLDDMLRVADAFISLEPQAVVLAGGEPLVVKGVFDVAERLKRAGVQVYLYTGGWSLQPWMVERIVGTVAQVSVSIDGATAEVHDAIRGRIGSFDRAMQALTMLDTAARQVRERGAQRLGFGLDCTLTRRSFPQVEQFCTTIAPRFPELGFISIGAAMPIGLASRPGFVDQELLTDAQADELASAGQLDRLHALAPPSVQVSVTDNRMLQLHPDLVARGIFPTMQVEPDGAVRAMAIYEGTVGNVLTENPRLLWERAVARWSDPVVVDALTPARTMRGWAEATRRIDYHFGSDSDRARIDRRPAYPAPAS